MPPRAFTWAAERLERGDARALSPLRPLVSMTRRVFERAPLFIPPHVSAVGVSGATLGGSYKTPLAIACARALAESGVRVAFIGHGYKARCPAPRVVSLSDSVLEVGDEALLAVQELAPLGALVIIAKKRADAIAFAAKRSDTLVVDGSSNITGGRSLLRVLSVPSDFPWGSGEVFPQGDLRDTPTKLIAGVDVMAPVHLRGTDACATEHEVAAHADLVLPDVCAESPGRRAGVFTAIARPTRFVRALEQRGIVPRVVVRARDHLARGSERQAARMAGRWGVDYWLTTEKCSFSLEKSWLGAPRYTVALRLALAPTFAARLRLLRDGP